MAIKKDNPEKRTIKGIQGEEKQNKKYTTICVGHHYAEASRNHMEHKTQRHIIGQQKYEQH